MRLLNIFLYFLPLFLSTVLHGQKGQIWGVTSEGGANNIGVIFKTDGNGDNFKLQKDFTSESNGFSPESGLVVGNNGKLFGLTRLGGVQNRGVLFEFDPFTKVYKKRVEFIGENGSNPYGSLIQASNGNFYGMTKLGGETNHGVIFEFNPTTNSLIVLHSFSEQDKFPYGRLLQASDGLLYGYTSYSIFRFNTETKNILFKPIQPTENLNSGNSFIQASNGKLYGFINTTGNNSAIIEYDITSQDVIEYENTIPGSSYGSLVELPNGKLYGITSVGIIEYDYNSKIFTLKYYFTSGVSSFGDLLLAPNGKLYGHFGYGAILSNSNQSGKLFEFDPSSGIYNEKFNFDRASGYRPIYGRLVLANDGKLYSTTSMGGSNNSGVIFQFDYINSVYSKVYDFTPALSGANPLGGLTMVSNGAFIGTTSVGGTNNEGVIYEFRLPENTYTKLIDFNYYETGAYPYHSPILCANGKMYGVTNGGGKNDAGIIYEFDYQTKTIQKKLDLFDVLGGGKPFGNLLELENGKLYGITSKGSDQTAGSIFEYDPLTNQLINKADLSYTDGQSVAGLAKGSSNKLFGLTAFTSIIFEYDVNLGNFVKKSFSSYGNSFGSLHYAKNSKLYGAVFEPIINGRASIIEYDPITSLVSKKIDIPSIGASTFTDLLEVPNGKLYGTTDFGATNLGSIFEYNPTTNEIKDKILFDGKNGARPMATKLTFIKENQSITFHSLSSKTFGDAPFQLMAISTSGLPISYTASDPSVASITGNTVTILKAGTISITAKQEGDETFLPASSVDQTLVINKAVPEISWVAPKDISYGVKLNQTQLNATAAIEGSFNYDPPSGALLDAGEQRDLKVEFIPIDLHNYEKASKSVKLNVLKAKQTIEFVSPMDKTLGDPQFDLVASSSSELPVTFASNSDKISIQQKLVTIIKSGRVSIQAIQVGNSNFESSTVEKSFCIKPIKPVITLSADVGESAILISSSSSNNQWYRNGSPIPNANEQTLKVVMSGEYTVQVSQDDCKSEFAKGQVFLVTDLEDPPSSDGIEIFPNPGNDWITINLINDDQLKIITIREASGRLLNQWSVTDDKLNVNTNDYPAGQYFIQVQVGDLSKVLRYFKVK